MKKWLRRQGKYYFFVNVMVQQWFQKNPKATFVNSRKMSEMGCIVLNYFTPFNVR